MDEQFEQWLTGFWEGDGSIGVRSNNYGRTQIVKVSFGQKDRGVLDYIVDVTGLGVLSPDREWDTWKLDFNGSRCMPLLEMFSKFVVTEHYCGRLNVALAFLDMPEVLVHAPTLDWFVGFWDAEGSSGLAGSPRGCLQVNISQKDRNVLEGIRSLFGFGSFARDHAVTKWVASSKDAVAVSQLLLERSHCVEKRARLEALVGRIGEGGRVREWMRTHPEEVEKLKEKTLT